MEIATMTAQEFGELIRTYREAQGLAVEDVAARLKLSKSTVRAIENGQIEDMPHAVYAKGFVRSYAQTVGIAAADLQMGLAAFFPDTQFDEVPVIPGPVSGKLKWESGRSGFARLVIFLLVLGCLGGTGWYAFANFASIKELVLRPLSAISSGVNAVSGERLPAPSAARENEGSPVAGYVPPPLSARETEPVMNPAGSSAAPFVIEEPDSSNAQAAAVQPESRHAPSAEPVTGPVIISGKQIAIRADEECWIQVSIDDGDNRAFTLSAGETSLLPYKNKMTLVLGNSGGVNLAHNGKPYVLNGKRNEKRTLTFQ